MTSMFPNNQLAFCLRILQLDSMSCISFLRENETSSTINAYVLVQFSIPCSEGFFFLVQSEDAVVVPLMETAAAPVMAVTTIVFESNFTCKWSQSSLQYWTYRRTWWHSFYQCLLHPKGNMSIVLVDICFQVVAFVEWVDSFWWDWVQYHLILLLFCIV